MKTLITGGAGYIGHYTALALKHAGNEVVVLDTKLLPNRIPGVMYIAGEIANRKLVYQSLFDEGIDDVIHLAAFTSVPESVRKPLMYYRNNTADSISFIETCHDAGIRRMVFASSAAAIELTDPYGYSKSMVEQVLLDTPDLSHYVLRYFNVAGHGPGKGLISIACRAALSGAFVPMYGDASVLRDYVHVEDVAAANLAALEKTRSEESAGMLEVGAGSPFSNASVVAAVEDVMGKPLNTVAMPERDSGAVASWARTLSTTELAIGWSAKHKLDKIIRDTLAWETRHGGHTRGTCV